jgi:peptide/nickel transport system substrate-binding protein
MTAIFRLALALLLSSMAAVAAAQTDPAHRPGRGSRRDGSDAGAHLCRPHRLLVDLRQAVRHRRKLAIVPQLALSHETSADGKTVTIKLRPGVTFHDGEPFDAKAAKYSLDRHLTMKGSFRKAEIASVDSVDVVDPMTIKLNLNAPFSPLLAQLTDRAGMMVSPKAAEAAGDKFGLHPVCAGPYKFVERRASRTASWSRSSRTTGTRTTSSSTRSPTCRSSTARCGWRISSRLAST